MDFFKKTKITNLSENDKLQIERYKKDRVTVRIWTSEVNINNKGDSCGHISVETGDTYMSLWPETLVTLGKDLLKKIEKPEFKPNYAADFEAEGNRKPEVIIHFYTLNKKAILEKFDEFKKICDGWSMLGRKNSESCASAAWLLLKAGDETTNFFSIGTQVQTSSSQSSKGSSLSSSHLSSSKSIESSKDLAFSIECVVVLLGIKSPDLLAETVRTAKNIELKEYPLTKELLMGEENNVIQENTCRMF